MKEKVFSLSGDDFTIATSTGQHICKCEGRMLSSKKVFTDMQGTGIFTIKKKYFALHKSFVCESPRGYNFEVNGHFSLGSSKSSVHFRNASDGQEIELDFKGDWFNRSAMITLAGRPVAELEKKSKFMNAGEFFGDQQTVGSLFLVLGQTEIMWHLSRFISHLDFFSC